MLCCWLFSVISMNWFINGIIMETKTGFLGDDTKIWVKFWEMISEIMRKIHHQYYQYIGSKRVRKTWWKNLLVTWIVFWTLASLSVLCYMSSQVVEKRKETLASMCDERARMLQDQFNVSMNHVQAMSIVISTFHHGKRPSTIDQLFAFPRISTTLYITVKSDCFLIVDFDHPFLLPTFLYAGLKCTRLRPNIQLCISSSSSLLMEKIYGIVRNNSKKDLSPLLSSCIHVHCLPKFDLSTACIWILFFRVTNHMVVRRATAIPRTKGKLV